MRNMTVAAAALVASGLAFGFFTPAITGDAEQGLTETAGGEWSTTRHSRFGPWESICEVSVPSEGQGAGRASDAASERCYLRLIDRFGPSEGSDAHDRFGAIAAAIQHDGDGLRITFDVENGLAFESGGFYLAREDFPVWRLDEDICLENGECSFSGPAADALVRAFSDQSGEALHMHVEFTDRYGQHLVRKWPMLPFAGAFADFEDNVRLTSM